MSEENKNLARRWFEEVWNQGHEAAIAEMYHPDGRSIGFPETDSKIEGPKEFAEVCRKFRAVFPDIHVTVNDLVTEGDKVAVLWNATMTHLGDGLGSPASARKVSLPGSSFLLCRGGQILEGRNQMDFPSYGCSCRARHNHCLRQLAMSGLALTISRCAA
jgi:predicted ester cyclase